MNIVTIDGIPVYQALVTGEDTGMLRISLVDDPAVQSDFMAFKGEGKRRLYMVQDEEKRLVLGVVMRADFPIYRYDKKSGEYYVIYKADTIRAMAEKYLAENRQNLVNLMHEDGTEVEGVQMVQYFIKGDGLTPSGFEDIADGSLFAEFHVTNDEVWAAVKDGTYRGFSLEGVFDLVPEQSQGYIEDVVDALDGVFSRIFKPKTYSKMKMKGLLARIAKALVEVEMGNVTTDKGIIAWDGDEDLKAGDAVFIEDSEGNRTEAGDGDYTTEDGKVIVVVDGKVSEIRDPAAEVSTEDNSEEKYGSKATDKGNLLWDGEDDLKEGDAVFVEDEEGNRVAAPDGDYVTEDGKTISVVDGKVASIADPKAEVAPEDTLAARMQRVAQTFQQTFDDKIKAIYDAIAQKGYDPYGWLVEAGEEFVIYQVYASPKDRFYRFDISAWGEDGMPVISEGVEVFPAFVTSEEREAAEAIVSEVESLRAQLASTPAAAPAHEVQENGEAEIRLTGNSRVDRLTRLMAAKTK